MCTPIQDVPAIVQSNQPPCFAIMEGQTTKKMPTAEIEESAGASGAASVVASTAEGKVSETVSAVDDSIKHVEEDDNEDQDRPSMSKSDEELDREVGEALACPCVADLRDGACGKSFVASFSCFIKSKEEERGMDCLEPFQALQECMIEHPEEFADFIKPKESEEEENGENSTSGFPNFTNLVAASKEEETNSNPAAASKEEKTDTNSAAASKEEETNTNPAAASNEEETNPNQQQDSKSSSQVAGS